MKRMQVYRCRICGNIVEVLEAGGGQLVCCGQPMELLEEKGQDEGMEKHVPVVERLEEGIRVRVGSIDHPMTENHYIQWIEIEADGQVQRKFLKPGEKPEAVFRGVGPGNVVARAYCNLHGLWKS